MASNQHVAQQTPGSVPILDALEERLAELVWGLRKTGVVTGTSGTKVIVNMGSGSVTLPRLATYTPVVNDIVNIIGPPPYLVLGKSA